MQSQLEKYTLQDLINSSNFSKVYFANSSSLNEKVIIKVISKENKKKLSQIKNEVNIPKLIVHKNIVKIIEFFETDSYAYVVYDYDEGSVSLDALKNNFCDLSRSQSLRDLKSILCQVCEGIRYMHSLSVIHRDIKPENIIVKKNMHTFIIDFNLSVVIKELKSNTDYEILAKRAGTPLYLAPEIWIAASCINYFLADIYSFGVVIFLYFNKKYPFVAKNLDEMEYVIRNKKPLESNSKFLKFNSFLNKLVDKNPLERPSINQIEKNILELEPIGLSL